jgi:nucleoside-triphosphatase THEP1
MNKLYDQFKKGDGYVSLKKMKKDRVLYYELMNLQTRKKQIFIINTDNHPNYFKEFETLGPYVFDLEYLKEVEDHIKQLIDYQIEPIYLDEIGILEAQEKFFSNSLKLLIDSGLDVYITVRESLVEKIIEVYNIKEYEIIK